MWTTRLHSSRLDTTGRIGEGDVRRDQTIHSPLDVETSLPVHGLVSELAGEIWYATSVMAALMLYGLAIFFFVFGILPYWFKLHKHLNEILGCEPSSDISSSLFC